MRIDEKKLADDVVRLVVECTELKLLLRKTWTRPMADEQRRYARARRNVTDLFILTAHSRGRVHARSLSAEDHARVAELTAARYAC
jgi:hypothetical protein